MRHGASRTRPAGLEMPDGFDPSGVPSADPRHHRTRAVSTRRRHDHPLPGLAPTSVIATVEEIAVRGETDWLVWGCADDRPVLFDVDLAAGAEMEDALARGEAATAIVEPWQLMLQRLD